MTRCKDCGSYAINHRQHGRDGSDPDLCDVCYWRKRATVLQALVDEVQAARAAALEEAAQIADNTHPNEWAFIAAAIRARKEQT